MGTRRNAGLRASVLSSKHGVSLPYSIDRIDIQSDNELDESVSNLIRDSLMQEFTSTQNSQSSLNPNLPFLNPNLPSDNLDLRMDTTDTTIPNETQNYLASKINEIEDPYDHGPNLYPLKKSKLLARELL